MSTDSVSYRYPDYLQVSKNEELSVDATHLFTKIQFDADGKLLPKKLQVLRLRTGEIFNLLQPYVSSHQHTFGIFYQNLLQSVCNYKIQFNERSIIK